MKLQNTKVILHSTYLVHFPNEEKGKTLFQSGCQTRVVVFFFNLLNLQMYFVIPAKSLTQVDRNDFVLKNCHWPTLAVSSSSRKCYSSLCFYLGLTVIEIRLTGISTFVAKKLDNV